MKGDGELTDEPEPAPDAEDDGPLTLGQFRRATADWPDELLIVLQKDPEGNGYLPAAGVEFDPLSAYFPRDHEVISDSDRKYDQEEQRDEYDSEEDAHGPAVPALVLWPAEHFTEAVIVAMPHPPVPVHPHAGPRTELADDDG